MGWRYYNHAMMSDSAPNESTDITAVKDGSVWNTEKGKPLLARWTENYDCGHETGWWYCILDNPFDVATLPSKKRYEINKGKSNFQVKVIDPVEYVEDIIRIREAAYALYPAAYRPQTNNEAFKKGIEGWRAYRVFGAFSADEDTLLGYACIREYPTYADFLMLKSDPIAEKKRINAALVAFICEYYKDLLSKDFFICDGERNVLHETAFQDYLIRLFGFRRAYCKLNIVYKFPYGIAVKLLYPFRKIIYKLKSKSIFAKISAVLKMEECSREG